MESESKIPEISTLHARLVSCSTPWAVLKYRLIGTMSKHLFLNYIMETFFNFFLPSFNGGGGGGGGGERERKKKKQTHLQII